MSPRGTGAWRAWEAEGRLNGVTGVPCGGANRNIDDLASCLVIG